MNGTVIILMAALGNDPTTEARYSPEPRSASPMVLRRAHVGTKMPVILCYGDSNTHGFDPASGRRFPRGVRWPGVVKRELGDEFEVVEEGLNGRTTVWEDPFTEGRNGRTYLMPCLMSHRPVDLVVLMLGTNDLKDVFRVGAAEIASGLATLVELIQRSGAGHEGRAPHVLLVVPPLVGSRSRGLWSGRACEESRRLLGYCQTVAEDARCSLVDAGAIVSPSSIDDVHLDASGHERLGRALASEVQRLVAAMTWERDA